MNLFWDPVRWCWSWRRTRGTGSQLCGLSDESSSKAPSTEKAPLSGDKWICTGPCCQSSKWWLAKTSIVNHHEGNNILPGQQIAPSNDQCTSVSGPLAHEGDLQIVVRGVCGVGTPCTSRDLILNEIWGEEIHVAMSSRSKQSWPESGLPLQFSSDHNNRACALGATSGFPGATEQDWWVLIVWLCSWTTSSSNLLLSPRISFTRANTSTWFKLCD